MNNDKNVKNKLIGFHFRNFSVLIVLKLYLDAKFKKVVFKRKHKCIKKKVIVIAYKTMFK